MIITPLIKKWLDNTSLGSKFVVLVIAILSLAMGFATYVNVTTQYNLLVSQLDAKGKMIGDYIVRTSPEYILSNDFIALNDSMKAITHEKDTVYSVLISKNGKLLTNYLDQKDPLVNRDFSNIELKDIPGLIHKLKKDHDVLSMSFPVVFEGDELAVYEIGIDKNRVNRLVKEMLVNNIIYNLIIILFLVVCIYVVFRVSALEPILKLIQGSKRVADGDFTGSVTRLANDELGKLTDAFNTMVKHLRDSVEEKDHALLQLQEFNRMLESRVEERTQEIERANRELEYLALHDGLTGLPNRSLLMDRLQQAVNDAQRNNDKVAFILMDLDRFKDINDALGHHIGDMLLCEVGNRINTVLRRADTIARLGGDEFSIVIPACSDENASIVARKIMREMDAPFELNDNYFYVGGSLGIAMYPEHGGDVSILLQKADVAMYAAKRSNKGFAFYDPELDDNSSSKLTLLSELKNAITNEELVLYFQPQVDVKTGNTCGVEALVRWIHKEKGMIPPDDFISIAEHSGLINSLTMWVLNAALCSAAEWRQKGLNVKMAVNISARNLRDPGFPEIVGDLLDKWYVEPKYLVLEITESFVMEDPVQAMKVLTRLDEMGVMLSIDDFGTGYSSLAYLQKLPVDEIKIDKSFVFGMTDNPDSIKIVRSIIDLSHNLGISVVAEGVENKPVWDRLEKFGCETVQGFYMSKPLPFSEVEDWFNNSNWKVIKQSGF